MPCAICGGTTDLVTLTISITLCKKDIELVKSNPLALYMHKDKLEISQIELAQEKL